MKKILFFLSLILFCGICVWGIITLNNKDTYYNLGTELNSLSTEKFYKDIPVYKGRIEDSVWVDGCITSILETPIKTITVKSNPDSLKINIGDSFQKEDILVDLNGKITKAPFNGRVENIIIGTNNMTLTILNYDSFVFSGKLNQELLGSVKINDEIEMKFNDTEYVGEIKYISNIVNDDFKIPFTVNYADPDFIIPFGASVKVKIIKNFVDEVIYIPEYALFKSGNGGYYVMVRDSLSEDVITVEVTTGLKGNGQVEITSGLTEGQTVLVDLSANEKLNTNSKTENTQTLD